MGQMNVNAARLFTILEPIPALVFLAMKRVLLVMVEIRQTA
jgi:hypothetical protein